MIRPPQAMRDEISQLRSLISDLPRYAGRPGHRLPRKPVVTRLAAAALAPAVAIATGGIFRKRLAEMGLATELVIA